MNFLDFPGKELEFLINFFLHQPTSGQCSTAQKMKFSSKGKKSYGFGHIY